MVTFLCETKSSKEHMERLKSQLNFDCLFSVPSRGSSGDLCVMWKEANLSLWFSSSNHLDFDVGRVGKPIHRGSPAFMVSMRRLIDIGPGIYLGNSELILHYLGVAIVILMK